MQAPDDTAAAGTAAQPVRRRRARRLAAGALLAALPLGAWVWAGSDVELSEGSWSRQVGADQTRSNDGFADTAWVVRGPGPIRSTLHLTIRNDGRFPVTVGVDGSPEFWAYDLEFATLDQMAPLSDESLRRPGSTRIRLAAGQEAEMRVVIDVDRCRSFYGGSWGAIAWVDLRVRQLGVTRSLDLPLRYPVRLVGPKTARPADC